MTSPAAAQSSALTPDAASVRGRFLWYDLMTSDVDAAERFYPAVTGWTVTPWAVGGGPPYHMWMNAGTPIGGVMGQPTDAAPAHWMPYIGTPDVDATHTEALALGARSHVAPTDIPTVGRFAVLADPQGAVFALFQPASPAAPVDTMPPVGTFSWHELLTSDRAAAWDFYARLCGWSETMTMDMGEQGPYQMFGQRAMTYGGVFTPAGMGVPPHWMLYVRVADLDRAIAAVRDGGGRVLNGPMEVPGGDHIVQCMDPQGALFALHATRHATTHAGA